MLHPTPLIIISEVVAMINLHITNPTNPHN